MLIFFTEPDDNLHGRAVDVRHEFDLAFPFLLVLRIDADRVNISKKSQQVVFISKFSTQLKVPNLLLNFKT